MRFKTKRRFGPPQYMLIGFCVIGIGIMAITESSSESSPAPAAATKATPRAAEPDAAAAEASVELVAEIQQRQEQLFRLSQQGRVAAENGNIARICSISRKLDYLMDEQILDFDRLEVRVPESARGDAAMLRATFTEQEAAMREVTKATDDLGCL